LLADAAGTANVDEPPQILLVFAADYRRMRRLYADLSYSLILKEVGAVFQLSMMAAAAMGLGACPLGCGDTRLFSELIGVDPMIESSVGELMLGSLE
jgi:SagB-type dehydrogenase family enzyme